MRIISNFFYFSLSLLLFILNFASYSHAIGNVDWVLLKENDDGKEWLDKNCPPSMRSGADPKIPVDEVWGGRNAEYKNPESKLWLDRMGEKGWTMPTVPKEYGGGGLSKDEVKVLNEELFRIGAKQPLLSFGIWMLAPVLLEYGSEEQKKRTYTKNY